MSFYDKLQQNVNRNKQRRTQIKRLQEKLNTMSEMQTENKKRSKSKAKRMSGNANTTEREKHRAKTLISLEIHLKLEIMNDC